MRKLKFLPLIGISILIFLIYKIGPEDILNKIIDINPFYLVLILLFYLLNLLSLTFKWYIILKIQKINLRFIKVLKLYLIGLFYGIITPAKTGSVIRASYLISLIKEPFGKCVSGIIIERIMDLFVLFIYSLLGIIFFLNYLVDIKIIIFLFGFFIFMSLVILKENFNKLIFRFVYTFFIPKKLKNKSKLIFSSFNKSIPPLQNLILPLMLTFINWIILSIPIYILFKSYSAAVPFVFVVLISSIGNVVSLIPITVGGLGTKEAAWIYLFSIFNIEPEIVISVSLINLFLGNILMSILGFLIALKEKSPKELF
ncbi:flippase-like domain-containing protein [Candidatus Woesearchaeota archaeon]|nr:flippase-like domain-containing protein [Candidatus Woesearchaeota archaeon]